MLKVGQLIKFVSGLNPQNTPTRLSFYNFLRGFPDPEETLTTDLIELFFAYCLDYPHWASNKNQLGNEVRFMLDNFNSYYQQKLDLSPIRFPQAMQLIEIEHFADLAEIVKNYLKRTGAETDKFRILNDQNKRAVAIVLHEDRTLSVRVFDKKFTIRDGELEPLRKDLALFYNSNLELSEVHVHKIEVAPYITAQFEIKNGRVTGAMLRGYAYQKLAEMKSEPLQEQTRLLYPIKRLEQFFVDRSSDPYYQEMVSQIERTLALVQQGDREAVKWSNRVLSQAETALENVFMGDKLLTLLVRDLRHTTADLNPNPGVSRGHKLEGAEECLKITPITTEFDLTN